MNFIVFFKFFKQIIHSGSKSRFVVTIILENLIPIFNTNSVLFYYQFGLNLVQFYIKIIGDPLCLFIFFLIKPVTKGHFEKVKT